MYTVTKRRPDAPRKGRKTMNEMTGGAGPRRMTEADLDRVSAITEQAKAQLRALGTDQWQYGYPNRGVWENDVRLGRSFVLAEDGETAGAFMLLEEPEPSYARIDGAWRTPGGARYISVHRVCVADGMKGRGLAGRIFAFALRAAAEKGFASVRVDTHPGNRPMQRALEKAGFVRCGTIRLAGGGPEEGHLRIAYERVLEDGPMRP